MTRRAIAVGITGALALAAPATAQGQSCAARGSHTVVRNSDSRVYWKGTFKDALGKRHRRYWGCAYHGLQHYRFNQRGDIGLLSVGSDGFALYTDRFRTRGGGRVVTVRIADFYYVGKIYGRDTFVRSYHGRHPAVTDAAWAHEPNGGLGGAFIATTDTDLGVYEVRRFIRDDPSFGSDTQLLDRGSAIEPRSLTLTGRTLAWLYADGTQKTAELDIPTRF
jgi:hypothetical protein